MSTLGQGSNANAQAWGQYTKDSQYTYLRCENFNSNNDYFTVIFQTSCPNKMFDRFTVVDNHTIKSKDEINFYRIR